MATRPDEILTNMLRGQELVDRDQVSRLDRAIAALKAAQRSSGGGDARRGGGDARLMRGSTATGGRPSASFRQETQDAMQRRTNAVQPTTSLEGQLALYAASLGNKDYVSADAINDYNKFPSTNVVANKRVTDPIANTQTVQRSTDAYNEAGFQQPVNYEAGVDDRGNPITEEYFQGESGRPSGYETYQQNLARLGREGAPNAINYFGSIGGMTPQSTGFDRMGNERPISSFPMPTYQSQFQSYLGQPDQIVDIMNPYNPYNDEASYHEMFRANQSGGYDPYRDVGMGVPLTVSQLNAQRAANAIAARNHYNRYRNAGLNYMGGY